MEGIRDVLKRSLGQSLNSLSDEDRLAAAWPVACGKTMAARGTVVGYDDGVLRVRVENRAWLRQGRCHNDQTHEERSHSS